MVFVGRARQRGVDDHRQAVKAGVLLDVARQREAVHLGHFQVGQHHGHAVEHGFAFGLGTLGDGVEPVPGLLAGLDHFVGCIEHLEFLLDERAGDKRIVGRQDDAAGLEFELGAHLFLGDLMTVRRRDHLQDRLHVQHLGQAGPVGVAIQAGDAGHQLAGCAAGLCRQHLLPVQAHDVFHRLDCKCLGGTRVFGHQHDVQARLGLAAHDGGQVQHRNHLSAQVDHPQRMGRSASDRRDAGHGHDLADLEDVDAEQLGLAQGAVDAQTEQQQLELVGAGEVGPLVDVLLDGFHVGSFAR